jgi:hypothetical protein
LLFIAGSETAMLKDTGTTATALLTAYSTSRL